jgi:hypothetical protein
MVEVVEFNKDSDRKRNGAEVRGVSRNYLLDLHETENME